MRITLKTWTQNEKAELMRICNNMNRMYLGNKIPEPYTEKDAEWWIDMAIKNEEGNGVFRAILCEGEYVGNISIEKKQDVYSKDAEIGYCLLKDKISQGIMTEAVKQICDIAWRKMDIIRITALVYQPNIASIKVLEKNDFILEGTMKNAVCKFDNIYDLCIYGKCRKE